MKNAPPYFEYAVPSVMYCRINEKAELDLPNVIDPNKGDTVFVSIIPPSKFESFVTYDSLSNRLIVTNP